MASVKYPAPACGEKTRCAKRFATKSWRTGYRDEEAKRCFFADANANTVTGLLDGLLDGVPTGKQSRFRDGGDDAESKYDVGPNVLLPRRDIVTERREIELAESPTFHVLDLPSGVTAKGDGDYERIQKTKDIYQNNRTKPLFKNDNIAQTINSFNDREDKECQTPLFSMNSIVTQVNNFNIMDAYEGTEKPPESTTNGRPSDRLDTTVMFLERILAQNTLNDRRFVPNETEKLSRDNEFIFTYCFTLALYGNMDKGLSVRCMHWNETDKYLLAVAYSKLLYRDYRDRPNAVALWNMRNPYTPERFYEFEESTITCLKFSAEIPNHLAVGFSNGEVLIIDVSSKSLKILFQKSKQSLLETCGILDLFWTIRIENQFPRISQYECLVTCSFSSRISRYRYMRGSLTGKTVMRLSAVDDDGERSGRNGRRDRRRRGETKSPENSPAPVCGATGSLGLDPNTYLVGTRDGFVYSCQYDNPTKYVSKTAAHFGVVRSLDKSPYSRDVYLTTGCDCSIKIWVGDVFVEPVITLRASRQIEKAAWSRDSSTVIASLIDNCVHVWDVDVSTDRPTSVREMRRPDREYSDLEFTPDGKHLCVSDVRGGVDVYAWSSGSTRRGRDRLLYCVAKSLYGRTHLAGALCKERPEYAGAFARLHDETGKSYFS